jgi:transcriptional regulator with XRE-family HTH domain
MSDIAASSALIVEARTKAGLTQRELARRAGTSQPAIARLERGQTSPTLAVLERVAGAAGFDLRLELVPKAPVLGDPIIEAYKRDVDRTLLRENLRQSPEERLRSLVELQDFGRELERAVRERTRDQ